MKAVQSRPRHPCDANPGEAISGLLADAKDGEVVEAYVEKIGTLRNIAIQEK